MAARDWRHLRGKEVTVLAGGIEYRGVVVELGETALLLRAPTGHREIPWETITRVAEVTPPSMGR